MASLLDSPQRLPVDRILRASDGLARAIGSSVRAGLARSRTPSLAILLLGSVILAGAATLAAPTGSAMLACQATAGNTCAFTCRPGDQIVLTVQGAGSGHARCAFGGSDPQESVSADCTTLHPDGLLVCSDTSPTIPGTIQYQGICWGFDAAIAHCSSR